MQPFLSIFTVSFIAALIANASPAGQPSQTPCTYTCPPSDQGGFPVGTGPGDVNLSSDPIFCSYPAFPGEDPNDFFCTYNKITGVLVTDNDAGLCTGNATPNCPPSKRRRGNALPRAPQSESISTAARKNARMLKTRAAAVASEKRKA